MYQTLPNPLLNYDAAPLTLQPGQPISAHDFVVYSEWSHPNRRGRYPGDDAQTDVLVGKQQARYRFWYVSGGRGFYVSNTIPRDDPEYNLKYLEIDQSEIIRFVGKAIS